MENYLQTLLDAGIDEEFNVSDKDSIIKYIMYKLYPDFYDRSGDFNVDLTDEQIDSRYEYIKSKEKEYRLSQFAEEWNKLLWYTATRTNYRTATLVYPSWFTCIFKKNRRWMRDKLKLDFMKYINVKYFLFNNFKITDGLLLCDGDKDCDKILSDMDKVVTDNISNFIRHGFDYDGFLIYTRI